jgi:hypothetical protein
MHVILAEVAPSIAARLAHQGWVGSVLGMPAPPAWVTLASSADATRLTAPRVWLSGMQTLPLEADVDVILEMHIRSHEDFAASRPAVLTLALQDSVFAIEHGFFIAVGGHPDTVDAVVPILDALAPQAGGWLYAGGRAAPHFLAALVREAGMNWITLASQFAANPAAVNIPALWQQQGSALQRIALIAREYLSHEQDAAYRPRAASINAFPPVAAAPGNRITSRRGISPTPCAGLQHRSTRGTPK